MSEKVESKQTVITENIHHFYCDDCGKYLGCTREYEDGYCPTIGDFSICFHIPSRGWRRLDKHFCGDCREKFLSELEDKISDLGFRMDG